MEKILLEAPAVLKALHSLRERRYRFFEEEDDEPEVIDGSIMQLHTKYELYTMSFLGVGLHSVELNTD